MSYDPPPNPAQTPLPRLLARGLDSLIVSYYLDFSTSKLDWAELATAKERIKRARRLEFVELTLGSQTFALMPYGRKPFTYVLTNKWFDIGLGEHMQPACTVRFASEALWTQGVEKLEQALREWFASIKCIETRNNVISRADWAFDYDFTGAGLRVEDFVSRATKDAAWRANGTIQSLQFGKGNVVVRVYDKITEIAEQSLKDWFFEIWKQRENVWRIEFQVRGSRLKQAGLKSTETIPLLQNDLLRELAERHTTYRVPNGDTNRSRWPLHPLWQSLQADIAAMPQTGLVEAIDPAQSIDYRLHTIARSLYGYTKGFAALKTTRRNETTPISFQEVLQALPGHLAKFHDPVTWQHDVKQRMAKLALGLD